MADNSSAGQDDSPPPCGEVAAAKPEGRSRAGGGISRRSALELAGGAAIAAAAAKDGSAMAAAQTKTSDLVMMNALELSAAIRAKRVSCVEVMTAYLDHIARLNPKVNAIVALQDRAGLIAQARE